MEWTNAHDTLLCREVLYSEPYAAKKGSNDRGKIWTDIAGALNSSKDLDFKVTQRSVRERFALIQAKWKKSNSADERSTGTSTVPSETDHLLEEITQKEQDLEEAGGTDDQKKKADRTAGT